MKYTLYGISLALLLALGCEQADTYKITGTWADGNGKTVYLCKMTDDRTLLSVDSAVVQNGTFEMTGPLEQIDRRILVVGNSRDNLLLDDQPIKVNITKQENPLIKLTTGADYDVQISGSREQAIFMQWKRESKAVFSKISALRQMEKENELTDGQKSLKAIFAPKAQSFLDSCRNSLAFTYIIGDDIAKGLGVNVELVRILLTTTAALLAASAVSVAGLLGFVGLVVPHTVRLLIGSDYRYLIPCSALLGIATVTYSDTLARMAFAPLELPVGIFMAALGAPFFLFLLRKEL